MMSDEVDSPAAFGRGPVDHIRKGTVMLDEIQVDRGKVRQFIPQIAGQRGGL